MSLQDIEIRIRTTVEGLESTQALQSALKGASHYADVVYKDSSVRASAAKNEAKTLEGLARAIQDVERRYDAMFRAGYRLQMLGDNMVRGGMRILGTFKSAADSFGTYEMKLRRAGLAVEVGTEKQQWLSRAIEKTSQELRLFSPEDVAEGLYYLGSATGQVVKNEVQLQRAMRDTNTIMFAASATNADFEESIKGVYSIYSTYKPLIGEIARTTKGWTEEQRKAYVASWNMADITKKLMVMANKTGNEFSDLNVAMTYAAGAAAQAGESFDVTLQTLGLLGDLGQRGSRAGRGLAMAYERLIAPPLKAEKALDKLARRLYGVNGNMKKMMFPDGKFIGTEQAVIRLAKAMTGMTRAQRAQYMAEIFTQNSARVMAPLIEAQIKLDQRRKKGKTDLISIYQKEKYSLKDYKAYYDKAEQSFKNTWQGVMGLLRNSFLPILYRVGEATVSTFTPVLEFVSGLLQKLTAFLDENPAVIDWIVKAGSALGVLLVAAGAVIGTIGSMMFTFAGFKVLGGILEYLGISMKSILLGPLKMVANVLRVFPGLINAVTVAMNLLKVAILTHPFVALAVAIGAILVLLYAWGTNMGGIREKVAEFFTWLQTEGPRIFNEFVTWLQTEGPKLANEILNAVSGALQAIGGFLMNEFIPGVLAALPDIANTLAQLGLWVAGKIVEVGIQWAQVIYQEWPTKFIDWIRDLIPQIGPALGNLWNQIVTWLQTEGPKLLDEGIKFVMNLVSGFGEALFGSKHRQEGIVVKLGKWFNEELIPWLQTNGPLLINEGLKFLGNLVEGAKNAIFGEEGILAKLKNWWDKDLLPWLQTEGPKLLKKGEEFIGNLVKGAVDFFVGEEGILSKMKTWWENDLLPWLQENGPLLIEEGKKFITNLVNGVINFLTGPEGIVTKLKTWWDKDFIPWLQTNGPKLIEEGKKFITNLVNGVIQFLTGPEGIVTKFTTWWNKDFIPWLTTNGPKLLEEGKKFITNLVNGVMEFFLGKEGIVTKMTTWWNTEFLPWLSTNGPKLIAKGATFIGNLVEGMLDVVLGRKGHKGGLAVMGDLFNEIAEGVKDMLPKLVAEGQKLAKKLWDAIRNFWNSNNQFEWTFEFAFPRLTAPWDSNFVIFDGGKVSQTIGAGLPDIPPLATGAWNIPYDDYLARLHKGEMVVPRTFAEDLRAASGRGFSFTTSNTRRIDVNVKVTSPDGSVDAVGTEKLASALLGSDLVSALSHMASVNS